MSLKTITCAHVRLISQYWTRFAVRSGSGLVYLMIVLTFGILLDTFDLPALA